MNRKLALNFRKHNDAELNEIAYFIWNSLHNNKDWLDIQTLLPPIQKTLEQFQHYRQEAWNGDTQMIIIKNDFKEKLISLLRELGETIQLKAKGDEWLILTSGYETAKPPKNAKLEKPGEFKVLPGPMNGQIILQSKRVKGAKAYQYQYTRGPVNNETKWETITSTQRKIVISDLPLGIQFFFQMAAIGARNQITYTDIVSRFIA
ncbi:hypothetical protein [Niastella sp. OAS944]|jgi:hypothetical protein|uniref:hypothetical protein n=1 Tax=Niastella sp. OAS944 TaxID=2664089 RepID=UPI0034707552|nr:hypothetical protein [Chitinophagaceae bacterium OAS944]